MSESQSAFPAGPRPGERDTTFFPDPMIDNLLHAIVTLTMELSVSRERVQSLEAVLAERGLLAPGAVDQHGPGEEEAARRAGLRARLIEDILGPMVGSLSREP